MENTMEYKERLSGIGERIYSERKRLGLSEQAVCKMMVTHSECLRKYEEGEVEIIGSHLQKLSELGFDVRFIITGSQQIDTQGLKPDEADDVGSSTHETEPLIIGTLQELGLRLEDEKKRLGLSSADVCSILNIHANTWRNYETSKRDIPASCLINLQSAGFNIPLIFTGSQSENYANRSKRASYEFEGDADQKTTTLILSSETGKSTTLWCDVDDPEKILKIAIEYLNS